ncbi:hypothetical protein [Hansschlegelia zhihuaiae]|uniref:TnsA endonuclease N-terminal domain-containing protein n=1 Tax=Hansschlegelia zhihuaiae TaxID=405005 RepID=A0A4Q0M5M7_9HYPH|nr:hypothetical protein [Hansschlegelia zhihuaiae]RXF67956.1 hypothetical protein EK403_20750 [Hansschlegelia zhihuaiae]
MLVLPHPTLATRSISSSSPYNYRGHIVDHERNIELTFESGLERNALWLWLASTAIVMIQEQPAAVEYFDDDGVLHHHTFDFLAVTHAGRRALVDVKPAALVERSNIVFVQQLIREQYGTSLADRYLIRTEQHMHPDDVADAKAVLRACWVPDPDADAKVSKLVQQTSGWLLIDDLVNASGLKAAGYNAVLRLIRARHLKTSANKPISYDAHVRRVPASH